MGKLSPGARAFLFSVVLDFYDVQLKELGNDVDLDRWFCGLIF